MSDHYKAEKPSVPVDFYWHIYSIEDEKDEKGRFFEGYCSVDDIDLAGERVTLKCMEKVVSSLPALTIFFNHDIDRPIGKVLASQLDERGLYVKGLISQSEDELWEKVKEGILSKMSIRLRNREGRTLRENGREVFEITDMEVPELSLTALPCCLGASLAVAYEKSKNFKEEGVVMGDINVAKILQVMKEAVKDIASLDAMTELRDSTFETVKEFVKGVGDKSTLTDDKLKEEIEKGLSSFSGDDAAKSSFIDDLLNSVKDHLKAEYGYPAPDAGGDAAGDGAGAYKPEDLAKALAVLEKAVKDLTSRVDALEKGAKSLSDSLPASIAEFMAETAKSLKEEFKKDLDVAVSSVDSVKEKLEAAEASGKSLGERVKSIESIVPVKPAGPGGGEVDGSIWKGVFPF